MTRFPAPSPQDPQESLPESEQRALVALAEELRAACADPAVAEEAFAGAVRAKLARPWTVWRTLERSSFARAAATLLVIVIGVAPVVALARMLPWFRDPAPVIGFVLPRQEPDVQRRAEPETAPAAPDELASAEATVRGDRLRRAAQSWSAAGPAAPAAIAAPRIPLWSEASVEELWQEFVRRCAEGDASDPPAALLQRVQTLAGVASVTDRRGLAPWLWVLRGEYLAQAEAEGAHAWPGAPWLGGR